MWFFSVVLFFLTVCLELVLGFFRFLALCAIIFIPTAPAVIAIIILMPLMAFSEFWVNAFSWTVLLLLITLLTVSFGDLLVTFPAFFGFGGSWYTKLRFGARPPTVREQRKLDDTFSRLSFSVEGRLKPFKKQYIVDSPAILTDAIGRHLYISTAALGHNSFPAIYAHELGHRRYGDGRWFLILQRLQFPQFYIFTDEEDEVSGDSGRQGFLRGLLDKFVLQGGTVALKILGPLWAAYFRRVDYRADQYAAVECGQKAALISYLETTRMLDMPNRFMKQWTPANEQRLDRLSVIY